MLIPIRPQNFAGLSEWHEKCQGVVFVRDKVDIEPLWELLCAQDDYWDSYKNLIKVVPKLITKIEDLEQYCSYTGKTAINEPAKIRKKIGFYIISVQD